MAFGDIGINGDLVLKGQIGIGTTTVNQLAYDATTDELQVFNKSLNKNVPIHGVDTNYYTVTSNTTVTSWSTVMVDTLGGTFTVTLPASPVQGDRIRFIDYKKNCDTAALTIGRNGKPIMGDSADMTVSTEGAAFELMFWDNTSGWCLMNV